MQRWDRTGSSRCVAQTRCIVFVQLRPDDRRRSISYQIFVPNDILESRLLGCDLFLGSQKDELGGRIGDALLNGFDQWGQMTIQKDHLNSEQKN